MTTFVQISDTHFGTTSDVTYRKANPYKAAVRLVKQVNALRPAFVIHTGDIVEKADDDAAYQLAQSVLAQLNCPIYYVTGNHDRAARIRQWLSFGDKTDLGENELFYKFSVGAEEFLVLDGRGADAIDPQGFLSQAQIDYLQALPRSGNPLTVFIHHALLPIGSNWIDEGMLLQNGGSLHGVLRPLRNRLRGVFHGHLHQSMQVSRDGITYICAPSAFRQFNFNRDENGDVADYNTPPAFNWINCLARGTVIRQFSVNGR